MPTLSTPRLDLQPMVLADLEWYAVFAGNAEVMRYIGAAGPLTFAEAQERLARYLRCWDEHGLGMFSVRLRNEKALIGWAGLLPLDGTAEFEVGYAFGKSVWGRGFATETASAVVRWGFEDRGLERIVAIAHSENEGSRHVMDKLGMRYEGMRPVHGADSVYYSLTLAAFARATSLRAPGR